MTLTLKQQAVVKRAPVAVAIVAAAALASRFIPSAALPADQPAARMAWALPWAILPLLWRSWFRSCGQAITVRHAGRYRWQRVDSWISKEVQVLRAILQNTLEQSVLAVGGYLRLSGITAWLASVIPAPATIIRHPGRNSSSHWLAQRWGTSVGVWPLTAYPAFVLLVIVAMILLLRAASWVVG
jgi:hypothetical protein